MALQILDPNIISLELKSQSPGWLNLLSSLYIHICMYVCMYVCIYIYIYNFLFCIGVQLINNVVIVSGEQWRDSAISIHVSIFPQTPLPSRLPHNTGAQNKWRKSMLPLRSSTPATNGFNGALLRILSIVETELSGSGNRRFQPQCFSSLWP